MAILALETSASEGSIALKQRDGDLISYSFEGGQKHSTVLFQELDKLGLSEMNLESVIVGLGPGSFSGIRVSIAAAQAIALVKKCPVVGISSTWSVALQKSQVTRLGVFADARRGERYVTVFKNGQLERETFLIKNEEVEEYVSKFTEVVSAEPLPWIENRCVPRASDYLSLPPDFSAWVNDQIVEPIYLREPVVG